MQANRRLEEREFFEERKEVLAQWPTGKDVDLEEAIEYHRQMPKGKNIVEKLKHAKAHGEIYASTGMGKATVEERSEPNYKGLKRGGCNCLHSGAFRVPSLTIRD